MAVYPDARLVLLHRDPVVLTASVCSLIDTLSSTTVPMLSESNHSPLPWFENTTFPDTVIPEPPVNLAPAAPLFASNPNTQTVGDTRASVIFSGKPPRSTS